MDERDGVPLPTDAGEAASPGPGRVVAVARDGAHRFSKVPAAEIRLLAGLGVEGDAHCGVTVKHRSRVAIDPSQPNLRQVHLLPAELFADLAGLGLAVEPAAMGENITTGGIELLALPVGTILRFESGAAVEVTGLRNPCQQIEAFRPGLLGAVLGRDEAGRLVRKAGIMGVVLESGAVRPGDSITVTLPPPPHRALERV